MYVTCTVQPTWALVGALVGIAFCIATIALFIEQAVYVYRHFGTYGRRSKTIVVLGIYPVSEGIFFGGKPYYVAYMLLYSLDISVKFLKSVTVLKPNLTHCTLLHSQVFSFTALLGYVIPRAGTLCDLMANM